MAVCFVLAALAGMAEAAADPMPMSAGEAPAPMDSAEVALVREELTIDVDYTRADVVAQLLLENRGPARKVSVGFPCAAGRAAEGVAVFDCRTRPTVKVGGRRVQARLSRGKGAERAWLWTVGFGQGEQVPVEVRYRSPLRNERYALPLAGMGALVYRLTTGARWAGPIGALDIRVTLPVDTVVYAAPAGATRAAGVLTWSLKDVEPAEDVVVLLDPMGTGGYLGAFRAKNRTTLAAARAAGRFDRDRLVRLAAELRRRLPELQEYVGFFAPDVVGRHAVLAPPAPERVRATVEESARLIEETARAGTK